MASVQQHKIRIIGDASENSNVSQTQKHDAKLQFATDKWKVL